MKDIYIFFFETQFGAGRMIRFITRNKFSHVALSFDPDTAELYSYARYRYHEPILSGFGIEATDRYARFGKPMDIKVCRIPVTDEHYARITRHLEEYTENQSRTRYNFFDVLAYPFHRHIELELCHTCLSFMLELLEIDDLHSINELEHRLEGNEIYEGKLSAFEHAPSVSEIDFFERRGRPYVYSRSGLTLLTLTFSLVKKYVS
ncbi:MAG: hypothetical protein RR314_05045 [Oscillospiraceae bacterium]